MCQHAINELKQVSSTNDKDYDQMIHILEKIVKLHETAEEWEDVIATYKEIQQIDPRYPKLREKLDKAEKMKKRAKSRDYYKILELSSRKAKAKEIRSQYKKLALIYHPDRCGQKDTPTEGWSDKKCENAFRDIADAKEVLSDKEKRKMFDDGVDPLDAEEQQQQNQQRHNPFHGFNPFGGGG